MTERIVSGALLLVALAGAANAGADDWRVVPGDAWCRERDGDGNRARYCEVRETTLRPSGPVTVDATPNGGISVAAGDEGTVRVQAKVLAIAGSDEAARQMVALVRVTSSGKISAEGPSARSREWWTVSYKLVVPPHTDLDLRSENGGITLTGVRGRTEFTTTNGGVRLTDTGGSMHGRSTNGGVKVALSGTRWEGEGLDVATTNGGVVVEVPPEFNAHLETGTTNGGLQIAFPTRVQGQVGHSLTTDLGTGGPTIRATTTNGGVTIRRR